MRRYSITPLASQTASTTDSDMKLKWSLTRRPPTPSHSSKPSFNILSSHRKGAIPYLTSGWIGDQSSQSLQKVRVSDSFHRSLTAYPRTRSRRRESTLVDTLCCYLKYTWPLRKYLHSFLFTLGSRE